ncbi:MAG: sulfoxide reductase heme-binding subunit YedZ [Limnohabitans sp.]|nr:sulfoxide reductase heme-binding subunit YedZ [Limnohabitans sp.]
MRGLSRIQISIMIGAVCALPVAWLFWAATYDLLGANPAEALIRQTGIWTLRFLCVVLAVTPLRVMTGWSALAQWRRQLGLTIFVYALLHFFSYAWLDMGFEIEDIAKDIVKRSFIWMGFSAIVLMSLLAFTSFNRAIQWLGAKRWRRLHQSIYVIAGLALLHFLWMRAGKNNFAEVALYAAIISALLLWRVHRYFKKKSH